MCPNIRCDGIKCFWVETKQYVKSKVAFAIIPTFSYYDFRSTGLDHWRIENGDQRGEVNGSRKFSSEIFLAAVSNHHQIQTSIRNWISQVNSWQEQLDKIPCNGRGPTQLMEINSELERPKNKRNTKSWLKKYGQKIPWKENFAQLHKHVTSAQLHLTKPTSTNHREENKFTTVNSKQVEEVN